MTSAARGRVPCPRHFACPSHGRRGLLCAALLLAAGLSGAGPARAETTQRDLRALARAASFMANAPTGETEFGIVFPNGSAAGRAEAEQIAAAAGSGVTAGALTLKPRLLPMAELAQSNLRVLVLTREALPAANEIAAATSGKQVLTVVTVASAIDGGKIVMSIASNPQIEILVNRAAAQSAGIIFAPAFRMLIKER